MTETDPDEYIHALAEESLAEGDATGWFERLYTASAAGATVLPWDREDPQYAIVDWAESRGLDGAGRRAVVVGCGYGRDAEYIASRGYDTTAFDVSESAVHDTRRRHPRSRVEYVTANLLALPAGWRGAFDLVVESLTVQSLPVELRTDAIAAVRALVAPGGTLLVVAAMRQDEGRPVEGPPWPLLRSEIDSFAGDTLQPVRVEELTDPGAQVPGRWRAEFARPAP